MKKQYFKKDVLVCFALMVLTLAFIFWNSLQNSTQSHSQSGFFVEFFKNLLGLSDQSLDSISYIVRKLAHFSEFALLGVEVSYLKKRTKWLCKVSWGYAFLFGVLVAITDESLQKFSDRTSSVTDVWIDFLGFSFGILLLVIVYAIIKIKFKKEDGELS